MDGQTSCWWRLPEPCNSLASSTAFAIASANYLKCTSLLGNPQPTNAASYLPSRFSATNIASTIYSCLQTAGLLCSYATNCATATYTVGQEPTTTAAALTSPTVTRQNPGFEAGSFDGWTVT